MKKKITDEEIISLHNTIDNLKDKNKELKSTIEKYEDISKLIEIKSELETRILKDLKQENYYNIDDLIKFYDKIKEIIRKEVKE